MKLIEKLSDQKSEAKLYMYMSYFFKIIITGWQEDQSNAAVYPGKRSRNEKNGDIQEKNKKNSFFFRALVAR